ncbi:Structural maintenance of chromosomes protein 6 [Puccinia graminis f. sp. tritici]|uniref:Structural maintenance of chromosomes protein 6 n=1 Tax=Puccinia graminis f. sp. tritici TaxID=56615 RepID=A0A5B0MGS8_PUCGR|nr:Structural maintenance of chromosomes protein 6 [Puccinia graminis f. sp. tritici]
MGSKHSPPEMEDYPAKKRTRINEDSARQSPVPTDDGSSESSYWDDPEGDACAERDAVEQVTISRPPGPPRQAGTISKVILVQFMCHRYQVVELGPQINFVIGHNGSGKSAVLTAITLLLGAKASSTNRGNSLKTFIREGQKKAEVTLHLTNRGEEAFQPEIYGDEIIIQRNISKDGSSGFKIKSSRDHRVVSSRRDGLQTILDHFMIQADNPLNVLNQDAAKKFLNSSSSKQKYDFFIRGTQLKQLTDEYEEIDANLKISEVLLTKKQEDLPELLQRVKSAEKNMREVQIASQAQEMIIQLEKEIFWIYVAEAEAERDLALQQLQNEERALPKYDTKLQETENKISELDDRIKTLEAAKAARNDDEVDAKRSKLLDTHRTLADKLKKINTHIRQADVDLKEKDEEISQQSRDIAEENAKLLGNTDSSRKQSIERMGQLDTEITEIECRITQIQQDISGADAAVKTNSSQANQCDQNVKKLGADMESNKRAIHEYGSIRKDRLLVFGQRSDQLKNAIERNTSWSEKPIGPLGYYIKVKDKSWQPVLETVLAGSLKSYMVVDKRDEQLLQRLMSDCKCVSPIIRTRRDLFDYSSGEPGPQFVTILRALHFEDEFVKRALINDMRIEKTILVEHRTEGDPIMSHPPPNIVSCYTRDGFKVGGVDGGRGVRALTMYNGPPRLSNDDGSFIAELNQRAAELGSQIEETKRQAAAANSRYRQSAEQLKRLRTEEGQLKGRLRKARDMKASIQDDLDRSASSNITTLEDLKSESESARRTLYDQSQELLRQRDALNSDLAPIKVELEKLQHMIENRDQEEDKINVELTTKITDKAVANDALRHFRDSRTKQAAKVAEAKKKYDAAEAALPKAIDEAKKVSGSDEPMQTNRSRQDAMADLESFKKIVRATETRHRKSLEDIEIEYHQANASYKVAEKQIEEQAASLKVLSNALAIRKYRWIEFRNHIAARAKMNFVKYLDHRRYTGKLSFNHNSQRLQVQVNPREDGTTQSQLKDPKTLSGGEKSYSTIALLLTLWDSINCPIRCLDEFDVFMDDVNRRVALEMMIKSAEASYDVQYVFITPNGLRAAQVGDKAKIIKMEDPTRNRGSLAAGHD